MASSIRAILWSGMVALAGLSSAAEAGTNGACLLTAAELQAATGRTFDDGQAGETSVDGVVQCHYAETGKPQRKLTVGVAAANAVRA
jgi:hypothetical protein